MKAKTRMFGEIDIQEDKIITLESDRLSGYAEVYLDF